MRRTSRTLAVITFCILLLAGGVLISGPDSFCSEKDPDERKIGPTKTAEVTIEKKRSEFLLTKELGAVRVYRHTEYVDQTGKKISYDLLAAPCKAVVVYEAVPGGDPEAVGVTVKRLLPGATRTVVAVPE